MVTKLILKEDAGKFSPPEDSMYYVLTSEGLMLGRNNRFFQSLVKAKTGPSELEPQAEFVRLRYPKFPKELLQQVVGFFSLVQKKHNSEAALIMVWNTQTNQYELICPDQEVPYAGMFVEYTMPDLPQHLVCVGTIHSHVDMEPFSSSTDVGDELARPGIHVVVGKIRSEPPAFHLIVSVDQARFSVKKELFFEDGYTKRNEKSVPKEWMKMLKVGKQPVYTNNGMGFTPGGTATYPNYAGNSNNYGRGSYYANQGGYSQDFYDGAYDDVYDVEGGVGFDATVPKKTKKGKKVHGTVGKTTTTTSVGTTTVYGNGYKAPTTHWAPGKVWVDGEWADAIPSATDENGSTGPADTSTDITNAEDIADATGAIDADKE